MKKQLASRIYLSTSRLLLVPILAVWLGLSTASAGVEVVEGVTGPGAQYAFFVPDGLDGDLWNGNLVVYAHGYVDPAASVQLPNIDSLRDTWLAFGYAVGYSSFSENGTVVKEGAQQTHQLRGLFASNFGHPGRTYITGHSQGGIIALMLAEKYPQLYDGALVMCAPVGGLTMLIDYFIDVRVLFDYFFPGVLPFPTSQDTLSIPEGIDFDTDVVPAVVGAVLADLPRAIEMAGVDQIELPFADVGQLINSILSPLFFVTVGTNDALARTHMHSLADNMDAVYTGSLNDAALNAGVVRLTSTPDAENFLEHYYQPEGDLQIQVLTLHTTADPTVPFAHEAVYAAIVANAGASDMLVQQEVNRYGHCTMNGAETIGAFFDLVNWVENGVTPPGGDVTLP